MNYWLDLFTGTTWDEFRKAGSKVTGFRDTQEGQAKRVEVGDVFLCYLTGVMRWVGALTVVGPSGDRTGIWSEEDFPVRLAVEPLIQLDPEHGVPMSALEGRVGFFRGPQDKGKYVGFVRRSPNLFARREDGDLIMTLLGGAQANPIIRPVDPKQPARKPLYRAEQKRGKTTVETVVSVPEAEEADGGGKDFLHSELLDDATVSSTRHTEIQYHLLKLGSDMGFDIWVARNDRTRTWQGKVLGEMPRLVDRLPSQFNDATRKTIELIDVLWLKGNSFVAAFEVECTTSVYSGLLRMSDLLALQPNLDIKLYLVAPDERRNKVKDEMLRPTFKLREKPLGEVCGFLAFSSLMEKVEGICRLGLAASLKPDFLEQTAEYFHANGEV